MKASSILILGFAAVLVACGGAQGSPVTPAPEGLTFLFFYTDG